MANKQLEVHVTAIKQRLLEGGGITHLGVDYGRRAAHIEFEKGPERGCASVFLKEDGSAVIEGMPDRSIIKR